jgi:hypothetical protein
MRYKCHCFSCIFSIIWRDALIGYFPLHFVSLPLSLPDDFWLVARHCKFYLVGGSVFVFLKQFLVFVLGCSWVIWKQFGYFRTLSEAFLDEIWIAFGVVLFPFTTHRYLCDYSMLHELWGFLLWLVGTQTISNPRFFLCCFWVVLLPSLR